MRAVVSNFVSKELHDLSVVRRAHGALEQAKIRSTYARYKCWVRNFKTWAKEKGESLLVTSERLDRFMEKYVAP